MKLWDFSNFSKKNGYGLDNFDKIGNFRLSLGSAFFLFFLLIIDIAVQIFVGQNVDKDFYIVHLGLILMATIGLAVMFAFKDKNSIPFFPSGSPYWGNILISLVISLAVGLLFARGFLSISTIQPFTIGAQFTDYKNIIDTTKLFSLYGFFAGFDEELAMAVVFFFGVFLFARFMPKFYNSNKGKVVALAFIGLMAMFSLLHLYSYSVEQQKQYDAYLVNPTNWQNLHPNQTPPQAPNSWDGSIQLIRLLLIAGFFRIINTLILIITMDLLLAIQTHILVNSMLLLLNASYPTYYQFSYFFAMILFFLMIQSIENIFSSPSAKAQGTV